MAVVHFFFTEAQFTSIIKEELFGITEFLCKLHRIVTEYDTSNY